jgi:hypothetical protein
MSELKITLIDASTGEVIEREMNSEELANQEAIANEVKQVEEDRQKTRDSALGKLAKLGLTKEEIASL